MKKPRPTGEVAVEIASSGRSTMRWRRMRARVVVVDANQFCVISQSVKKTDPVDARLLPLYLSKGLQPEVRMAEVLQLPFDELARI